MKTSVEIIQCVTLSVEEYNRLIQAINLYQAAVDWVQFDAIHQAQCPLNPYYIQDLKENEIQCNCGLNKLRSDLKAEQELQR